MSDKPRVKLTGTDGNIFLLMGKVQKEMIRAGLRKEAEEMVKKIHDEAEDYYHALSILGEYVEVY